MNILPIEKLKHLYGCIEENLTLIFTICMEVKIITVETDLFLANQKQIKLPIFKEKKLVA